MQKKERNRSLDVLKGIAILFIIITHYAWSNEERLLYGFPYWIDMAVTTFMVISGYLYAKSFEYKGIDSFDKAYEFKFVFEKLLRFTVPFLVAFFIEIAFIVINNEWNKYNFLALFLQGGLGPGSYYYPVMIQFVFIFPVIFFIVKKHQFKGLFICMGMNAVYELLHWAYGMSEGCYRLIALRYIFVIAFGVFLNYKEGCNKVKEQNYKRFLYLAFVVGIIYIYITCYTDYQPKIIIHWTRASFIGSMYFIPILDWLIGKGKIKCRPLEILGKASFNIFLTQMVFFNNGVSIIYSNISNVLIRILVSIIICSVIGVLFWWIEQPITKWIVNKMKVL